MKLQRIFLFLVFAAIAAAQTQVTVTLTLPCPTGVTTCTPSTATGTLTLYPAVALTRVAFVPTVLQLGQQSVGTVILNVPAPVALTVTIGAYPAGLSGPSSCSIAAGATTGTFTVTSVIAHSFLAVPPSVTNWAYGLLPGNVSYNAWPHFLPTVWMGGAGDYLYVKVNTP